MYGHIQLLRPDGNPSPRQLGLQFRNTLIGRDSKCAICINVGDVEPVHAKISVDNQNKVWLSNVSKDSQSILRNGVPLLTPKILLLDNDCFSIYSRGFRFKAKTVGKTCVGRPSPKNPHQLVGSTDVSITRTGCRSSKSRSAARKISRSEGTPEDHTALDCKMVPLPSLDLCDFSFSAETKILRDTIENKVVKDKRIEAETGVYVSIQPLSVHPLKRRKLEHQLANDITLQKIEEEIEKGHEVEKGEEAEDVRSSTSSQASDIGGTREEEEETEEYGRIIENSFEEKTVEQLEESDNQCNKNGRHLHNIQRRIKRPKATSHLFRGFHFFGTMLKDSGVVQDIISRNSGLWVDSLRSYLLTYPANGACTDKGNAKVARTFLLANDYRCSAKYFAALALGIPCVKAEWVKLCDIAKKILPYDKYLLPAGFSNLEQKVVAQDLGKDIQCGVFDGLRIELCISADFSAQRKDEAEFCKIALHALGARATDRALNGHLDSIDYFLCLDNDLPNIYRHVVQKATKPVVTPRWFRECLLLNRVIDPSSHYEFAVKMSLSDESQSGIRTRRNLSKKC